MVPAGLLLVVGMVYGVEEEQGKVEMVGLLACPEREGGGWLACGGEGRCISKTQVNQIISLPNYSDVGKSTSMYVLKILMEDISDLEGWGEGWLSTLLEI